MIYMLFSELFRMKFSYIKIFNIFEVLKQKQAKYENISKIVQNLFYFTLKFGFFGKLQGGIHVIF